MTYEVFIACSVLLGSIALFLLDRFRLDVVALLALVVLALSGILDVSDLLAGFSSPVVITITGLFVIGAGLSETGVAEWIGQRLERVAGKSEIQTVAVAMLATSLLSAFMSSTGTVAILLPIIGTLAKRRGIPIARLLMPVAFAAHLGSNLTLISTPPNLIVSDALRSVGREPFQFFSFTGPGIILLVLGTAWMIFVGRRQLPSASRDSLISGAPAISVGSLAMDYALSTALGSVRIPMESGLVGLSLQESALRSKFGVTVVDILRHGPSPEPSSLQVLPKTVFAAGDELRLLGRPEEIAKLREVFALVGVSPVRFELPGEDSLVEVVLPRRSSLVGRTLATAKFRDRFRATVLAARRGSEVLRTATQLQKLELQAGDTLLLQGQNRYLRNLRQNRDDIVLVAEPDSRTIRLRNSPTAIAAIVITLLMVITMAMGWLPSVIAVVAAALALVLARCVRPADVYRAVNWESIVLIACMMPVATALEKSGAIDLAVHAVEGQLAAMGPYVLLVLLVLVTSVLGMVLSNTTTAVLIAPLAVRLAEGLSIAPEPLLIAVACSASAAFATPISSPVNVLVMGPAGYRFADFVKVGVPLLVLTLAALVLVVPLMWNF